MELDAEGAHASAADGVELGADAADAGASAAVADEGLLGHQAGRNAPIFAKCADALG